MANRVIIGKRKNPPGGENSVQGAERFEKDVLCHQPDLLFIDYALNDRGIGLPRAKEAWEYMIREALKKNIKVVLITPAPDISEKNPDDHAQIEQHSKQIIAPGVRHQIPVVDACREFKKLKKSNTDLSAYMAQSNHINEKGHEIVAGLMAALFGINTSN